MTEEVIKQVERLARRATVDDIDGWWRRVVDRIVALVAGGWSTTRTLAEEYLVEHAELEGVDLEASRCRWEADEVATSLRVTGPVAFKQNMAITGDAATARKVMGRRLAGAAERLVMAGERETVQATIDDSREIVGWRRVTDGDPCAFCAMLAGRGAVYKTGRRAGDRRFGGNEYHDNDGCTAEPLYEFEDEPDEVNDLYAQWRDVTSRLSGDDAIKAWRRYWDGRNADASEPSQPRRAATDQRPEPAAVNVRAPEPMPVPEFARRYHRDLDGLEDLARAVESRDFASDIPLTGGVSAETSLVTTADGTKLVRKFGGNAEAEQAASMIGRAVGVRTPRVYRNHVSEVWMDYIDDAKTWDQLAAGGADWARRSATLESDDGKLIGLFDMMISNADRNDGNWMLGDGSQVHAIDHGHAFVAIGDSGRIRARVDFRGPFSTQWVGAPNDLTPADIALIRERLTALEPDFDLLGRARWLQYALAILDAVEPFARGTRNLVAGVR